MYSFVYSELIYLCVILQTAASDDDDAERFLLHIPTVCVAHLVTKRRRDCITDDMKRRNVEGEGGHNECNVERDEG